MTNRFSFQILILFLGLCQCGNRNNSSMTTIKYFGTLTYYVNGINPSNFEFEVANQKEIVTLDSIIDFSGTKASSGTRIYAKAYIHLFRVMEDQDTICYYSTISEDNFAYTDSYTNCETGLLIRRNSSRDLAEYFNSYFQTYGITIY